MKKLFALILALAVLAVPAAVFAADYSSMSDDELLFELNRIRTELASREINPEKVICRDNGMTLSFTGMDVKESFENSWKLEIDVTAVNAGDKPMAIMIDKVYANGWELLCFEMTKLDPGKRVKKTITIYEVNKKADILAADEVDELEFYCYSFDPDTYDRYSEDIKTKIVFGLDDGPAGDEGELPPETELPAEDGIEGTWAVAEFLAVNSPDLSEEERAQALDENTRLLKEGLIEETITFRDGAIIMWVKADGSVYNQGEPIEQTVNGSYTIDGNRIIVLQDGSAGEGDPAEFELEGDTLILVTESMTVLLTRK